VTKVDSGVAQVIFRFVAQGVRPGDRLRIEWVDPLGQVSATAAYDELPRAPELCFMSAMPVGGFAPSTQPGMWTARAVLNGVVVHEKRFEIEGAGTGLSARVVEVNEKELGIDVRGATSETSVNIARYTPAGGWTYIAPALADRQEGGRMWVKAPKLDPGEYLVILRNPDGQQSPPARFVISTGGGYRMPTLAGERWRISQRPYGTYSHWGRALHAYDIAPVNGRYVAAMRGGIAHAHDLGLGQTPGRRIFGNYITIDHGDGEYSHYAHLRARSFLVRTGQRVEAGEALAEVGNSGYSFGRHVHVHVTRTASISAQSVPFRFEEKPAVLTKRVTTSAAKQHARTRWEGDAGFAQWWTRLLPVPQGARSLAVKLGWEEKNNDYDLYVVSPSGRTYRVEEDVLRLDAPEAGQWRVSVQAVRVVRDGVGFWVEPEVTPSRQ
jgi:murein DD-endopeptidase MepM/ murein hydrolase activator NlpD